MPRRDALLLRVTALWTFFVWGVFVRNLLRDDTHPFAFKAVHVTLAVVSVGLGVGLWRVAARSRRRSRDDAGVSS